MPQWNKNSKTKISTPASANPQIAVVTMSANSSRLDSMFSPFLLSAQNEPIVAGRSPCR